MANFLWACTCAHTKQLISNRTAHSYLLRLTGVWSRRLGLIWALGTFSRVCVLVKCQKNAEGLWNTLHFFSFFIPAFENFPIQGLVVSSLCDWACVYVNVQTGLLFLTTCMNSVTHSCDSRRSWSAIKNKTCWTKNSPALIICDIWVCFKLNGAFVVRETLIPLCAQRNKKFNFSTIKYTFNKISNAI